MLSECTSDVALCNMFSLLSHLCDEARNTRGKKKLTDKGGPISGLWSKYEFSMQIIFQNLPFQNPQQKTEKYFET